MKNKPKNQETKIKDDAFLENVELIKAAMEFMISASEFCQKLSTVPAVDQKLLAGAKKELGSGFALLAKSIVRPSE